MSAVASAVVFGYHHVGVRGLLALLACGVDVRLVVTHRDDPAERIWFPSLADAARDRGIAVITPDDPNTPAVVGQVADCAPDHLYSLYYRHMLQPALLAVPQRRQLGGAFNVHGSLLPKYRGRVPVNWALIHGETETGATLHVMDAKPDAGAIVDQCAVPVLPDDTAADVFNKVVVAAEMVLVRSVPRLIDGSATLRPQRLRDGSYFGGRRPDDGRIDPQASVQQVHDFVRALTRPFPGAFLDSPAGRVVVWRTARSTARHPAGSALRLHAADGLLWLTDHDGRSLRVVDAQLDGSPLSPSHAALPLAAEPAAHFKHPSLP